MYKFGDKLVYLRKLRKMTQGELAAASYQSVTAINQYETNKTVPNYKIIEKLALALDVSPTELRLYLTPQEKIDAK